MYSTVHYTDADLSTPIVGGQRMSRACLHTVQSTCGAIRQCCLNQRTTRNNHLSC